MKALNVKIEMISDGFDCSEYVQLIIPDNIDENKITSIIKEEHKYLCEDTEDIYGFRGKAPETLLDYVCEKYKWSWTSLRANRTIILND